MGTVCWGHSTDVVEDDTRTFSGNWTGDGEIIGSGDSEVIQLDPDEEMISEPWETGTIDVAIEANKYRDGSSPTIYYRTSEEEQEFYWGY